MSTRVYAHAHTRAHTHVHTHAHTQIHAHRHTGRVLAAGRGAGGAVLGRPGGERGVMGPLGEADGGPGEERS